MAKQLVKQEKQFLGTGWAFPVTFSAGDYKVGMSSFEDNVNQSINTILKTRMGERSFEPGFGSGVQQFFFRKVDSTLRGEIIDAVKNALLHNEPRITVLEVDVDTTDTINGIAKIFVTYEYNQTNTRHNHVFPFHIKEGTNL